MSAASSAQPLGSGDFVDSDGHAVVTNPTEQDCLVIARLQDVEDHPDLLWADAA